MTPRVNRRPSLFVRAVLKTLLALPVRWRWHFRVIGRERLPTRRRPLILACNHAALIDTLFLILAVRPRFTVCGAKPRYFRTARLRLLMAIANILRVEDHSTFLSDCTHLLETGEVLLIYPEMGRNPDGLGEFSTWAAEAALATSTSVLPCYLYGTARGHTGAVRLFVGREIEPVGDSLSLTARLRESIEALSPSASPVESA